MAVVVECAVRASRGRRRAAPPPPLLRARVSPPPHATPCFPPSLLSSLPAAGTRPSSWKTWPPWAAACPPCSRASGAAGRGRRRGARSRGQAGGAVRAACLLAAPRDASGVGSARGVNQPAEAVARPKSKATHAKSAPPRLPIAASTSLRLSSTWTRLWATAWRTRPTGRCTLTRRRSGGCWLMHDVWVLDCWFGCGHSSAGCPLSGCPAPAAASPTAPWLCPPSPLPQGQRAHIRQAEPVGGGRGGAGGRGRRRGRREAAPLRLCAVEGGQAGRALLGVTMGRRPAGCAGVRRVHGAAGQQLRAAVASSPCRPCLASPRRLAH